jgi:hypothetical protein
MRVLVIAGAVIALGLGTPAWAEDEGAAVPKAPPPPEEVTVKVQAPEGTSEEAVAAAIAAESARREPGAQHAAQVAKQRADADASHAERVAKICDSIPEKALRDDPSLRKLCR